MPLNKAGIKPRQKEKKRPGVLISLVPSLLVLIAFSPVLQNDFVNWDDLESILRNGHIQSLDFTSLHWMLTTFTTGNWMPLTWISFALNFAAGGLDPKIFHLTNFLLHAVNTYLVFWIALKILGAARESLPKARKGGYQGEGTSVAFLTAILFGLHPIHVESVAWAAERKDVLYAFFYLAAIGVYLEDALSFARKKWKYYACLGFFVLSVLSKPMAVTLPIVLLILDGWPLGRLRAGLKAAVLEKIPFFIVALAGGVAAVIAQGQTRAYLVADHLSAVYRMVNACRSLAFYIWQMAFPFKLVPLYPFPRHPDVIYGVENVLAVGGVVLVSVVCFLHRKEKPQWTAAWLYYLATLAPVLGLLQVGSQAAADRYTYLPGLAFLFPVSLWFVGWTSRHQALRRWILIGLTLILGWGTTRQIGIWRNSTTLWEYVVKAYPDESQMAQLNLGTTYLSAGRMKDAFREYERAVAIPPPWPITHNDLGVYYLDEGQWKEAEREFKIALSLDPRYISSRRNLAFAYEKMGLHEQALAEIQAAQKLNNE